MGPAVCSLVSFPGDCDAGQRFSKPPPVNINWLTGGGAWGRDEVIRLLEPGMSFDFMEMVPGSLENIPQEASVFSPLIY